MIDRRGLLRLLNLCAVLPQALHAAASERIAANPAQQPARVIGGGVAPEPLAQQLLEIENKATIRRVNCGHSSDKHSLAAVRRYQRDVHSPAIARRPGIYEYRHFSFDPIQPQLFAAAEGIELHRRAAEQINSLADVLYLNVADQTVSVAYPPADVRPLLVADNSMIQKWAAAYHADRPGAARTFVDTTGIAVPQGPPAQPSYCLLLRQRADARGFQECVGELAQKWSVHANVRRLRLTFLDPAQDAKADGDYGMRSLMAEQKLWHQAWIDLVIESDAVAKQLLPSAYASEIRPHVSALHAYPVAERYTYVYAGRPTLVGLRGYAAYQAIEEFHAANQKDLRILQWMYGPVVQDGPVAPGS